MFAGSPRAKVHHPPAASAPHLDYAQGDVVGVDAGAGTLFVHPIKTGAAADLSFRVDPERTLIRLGTSTLHLEDVRPGDHATISYPTGGDPDAPPIANEIKLARAENG